MAAPVSCPVCAAAAAAWLRKDGVEIHRCTVCGLGFWRPDAAFRAASIYDGAYFEGGTLGPGYDDYGALELAVRRNFARRIAALGPPTPGARLLDLGAAYGFAVDEARRAGWRASGLEISAEAARRAVALVGGVVVRADAARTPFASARFEVITLWDVLEHLPDPHAVMAEIARLLTPGGRLVLTTGDAGSLAARVSGARGHLLTLPEHLFFHSRESLRQLLAAHGLRVVSMHAESSLYPLGYLAERLRKTLLRRPARRAPRWPGAAWSVPVNLFDVVTVRAERRAA
jgi:SAM-dependent methyltransferase